MLPRNGKALSQPHDAWPVLALDANLLRCRDKAAPDIPSVLVKPGCLSNPQEERLLRQ